MKAKRRIESSLNSVTMLDGTGGHVTWTIMGNNLLGSPTLIALWCAAYRIPRVPG
jgi:hypothetical protein